MSNDRPAPGGEGPTAGSTAGDPVDDLLPSRIGPYRILDKLGEGGFGSVYLAEQETPLRRRVALKVIKLGMDTKQVIARFEAERQALALMNHPSIAAVLDAGTTERGRPFFVMELVRGEPITGFCDRRRLGTDARLRLFVQVCMAVQHAHQRGIIHRDIKPSNVLVAEEGGQAVPKVIDFGIAKAIHQPLTEKTLHTQFQQVLGTPAYMSPEQARYGAADIDTRTDVYSLGALLYELLTGQPPLQIEHEDIDYQELRRRVREQDPKTPSTLLLTLNGSDELLVSHGVADLRSLHRQLRGELDWITLKALEKDRARRYETAVELARDIERRLANEPVVAGPPGTGYRLKKWVQRNRGLFAMSAAVLLTMVVGLATASWGLLRAQTERDRALTAQSLAEAEARKAAEVNRYLNEILLAANPNVSGGEELTVRALLEAAAARLEAGSFAAEPAIRAALLRTIGDNYGALGRFDDAELHLRAAVAAAEQGDPRDLATILERLGVVLLKKGDYESGQATYQQALDLRRDLRQSATDQVVALGGIAEAAAHLGWYAEAEAHYQQALLSVTGTTGDDQAQRAALQNGLAQVLELEGRLDEAIELFREAIATDRQVYPARHSFIADGLNNLAATLEAAGRYTEAEATHREALEMRRRVLGDAHPAIANSLANLGLVLWRLERHAEAEAMLREALEISEQTLQAGHFRLAIVRSNLALPLLAQGRLEEADALFEQALEIASRALPAGHIYFPVVRANRADGWRRQGRLDEAEAALLIAYDDLAGSLGGSHRRTQTVAGLVAALYGQKGADDEARRWRERAGES